MTCEAFEDFRLGSVTLTRLEVEAIKNVNYKIPGRGENQEFKAKIDLLNLYEGENSRCSQRASMAPVVRRQALQAQVPRDVV